MNERRRMLIHVSSEMLAALLRLPDDVKIARFELDHMRDTVIFAVESDRFEPVPPEALAGLSVERLEDGTMVQRVTWPQLDNASAERRLPDVSMVE